MTAADRYFDALAERLALLRSRSGPAIESVAEMCATALRTGGRIHIYDSGHLVSKELIMRAGGLAAMVTFEIDPVTDPPDATPTELVTNAFSRNQTRGGDVLFVGSVSGTGMLPVEICRQAVERGLQTIALTSIEYSSRLDPKHPSGKRLFEVADLVIDNAAPYGDGMLLVDALDQPCCPFSGVGAVSALWAVVARTIEMLTLDGLTPTVFASVNLPDGPEQLERAQTRYRELGY